MPAGFLCKVFRQKVPLKDGLTDVTTPTLEEDLASTGCENAKDAATSKDVNARRFFLFPEERSHDGRMEITRWRHEDLLTHSSSLKIVVLCDKMNGGVRGNGDDGTNAAVLWRVRTYSTSKRDFAALIL